MRVLIVEDEALVALELEELLLDETSRIFGIIRGMHPVLAETDRVRQLVGTLIDVHLYAKIGERCDDRRMEIRDRLGMKRHLPSRAVAGLDA
jgi:hypothetical protein